MAMDTACAKLREAGLLLLHSSLDGTLRRTPLSSRDWLERMIVIAPLIQRGVTAAIKAWNEEAQPRPLEILPGLWAAAIPRVERRKRIGYAILFIPTEVFLQSEFLPACC